jgi:cell division protein FtsB
MGMADNADLTREEIAFLLSVILAIFTFCLSLLGFFLKRFVQDVVSLQDEVARLDKKIDVQSIENRIHEE